MNPSNGRSKAIAVVALLVVAEILQGTVTADEALDLARGMCPDEAAVLAVSLTVADLLGVQIDAIRFTVKPEGGEA